MSTRLYALAVRLAGLVAFLVPVLLPACTVIVRGVA